MFDNKGIFKESARSTIFSVFLWHLAAVWTGTHFLFYFFFLENTIVAKIAWYNPNLDIVER